MPTSTQTAARAMLDKETDARFWAQTGYKPGQKLDPTNPTDRAMTKVWLDIYAKVSAEDRAGKLVLTFNHPKVDAALSDAQLAHDAAVSHLDAAASAPDAQTAATHTQAASDAAQLAQQKAAEAATVQPPTASPIVAQAASVEAHAAAQQPPPGVVVFPVGHPAHWHPSGRPANPSLTHHTPLPPSPPQSAEDHLALAQAGQAPAMTGAALVNGAHWAYSDYQRAADAAFAKLGAPAGVVAIGKDGAPIAAQAMPDHEAASTAYDAQVNAPGQTWYLAFYDASQGGNGGGRIDETYLGGMQVEHTTEHTVEHLRDVPRDVVRTVTEHANGMSFAQKLAIGGLVAGSILAIVLTMHRTGGTVPGRPSYRPRMRAA